jgi:hypothetical protein
VIPFSSFLLGVAAVLAALIFVSRRLAFRGQTSSDYAAAVPQFDIRHRLNGEMICEGVIYGPTGRVSSRFVADMTVVWKGNVARMTETFRYDSGNVQDREWILTVGNDGSIKAEAADVVGVGTGQESGSAVVLNYRIKLAEEAGGHVLDTTDWMYVTPNGSIINRSQFRKFGIKVAELVATMRPKEAA